jgi:hypothetical protein
MLAMRASAACSRRGAGGVTTGNDLDRAVATGNDLDRARFQWPGTRDRSDSTQSPAERLAPGQYRGRESRVRGSDTVTDGGTLEPPMKAKMSTLPVATMGGTALFPGHGAISFGRAARAENVRRCEESETGQRKTRTLIL